MEKIGRLSLARLDFSQLSSRYAALRAGELPNIFNPVFETGALMDLGIYCIYPALYYWGMPQQIDARAVFLPSGADGSGCALFTYPDKLAVLTYSKTGQAAAPSEIQGDRGTVAIQSISQLAQMTLTADGQTTLLQGAQDKAELMGHEALDFYQAVVGEKAALDKYRRDARLALDAARCLHTVRRAAGIRFPRDC